jgi:hypothetical protein
MEIVLQGLNVVLGRPKNFEFLCLLRQTKLLAKFCCGFESHIKIDNLKIIIFQIKTLTIIMDL